MILCSRFMPINAPNILKIMASIVNCLNDEQLAALANRFIFVEYVPDMQGYRLEKHSQLIHGRRLVMRQVQLADFGLLYRAMQGKRTKLPVRLLRRFKQELYDFTLTSTPTGHLRVASIDDTRLGDDQYVMSIGKVSDFGLKGLNGLTANEWYRDIVRGDIDFSADDILQWAFPRLIRQNSGRLPVNKYLARAKGEYPEAEAVAREYTFDKIVSRSFREHPNYAQGYCSIGEIARVEGKSIKKATRLMAYLPEQQIGLDELEDFLVALFEQNAHILDDDDSEVRTNIRRLIRVYDYMKWGKPCLADKSK